MSEPLRKELPLPSTITPRNCSNAAIDDGHGDNHKFATMQPPSNFLVNVFPGPHLALQVNALGIDGTAANPSSVTSATNAVWVSNPASLSSRNDDFRVHCQFQQVVVRRSCWTCSLQCWVRGKGIGKVISHPTVNALLAAQDHEMSVLHRSWSVSPVFFLLGKTVKGPRT